MERVAIVTDSAACIPDDFLQEYDIHVVPFRLIWGHEVLRDGVDISPAQVYQRIRNSPHLPTSSQPTPEDFREIFEELSHHSAGIVSLHIPERVSGTFRAAELAVELVSARVPIRVVDCGTAATGQGLIVLAAARAAHAGAALDDIVRVVEMLVPRTTLLASLTDLSFIQRGGRVRAILAVVGSMLKIVPVFSLRQGQIKLFARARTQATAVREILDEMTKQVGGASVHAAILHADMPGEATNLRAQIAHQFNCAELWVSEFTPVMGAHTGPGVIGVAFYAE